ncbi:DUF2793 domain-containing protein [Halocynthiibacter namhaensis]|uniref:DUF2793 domain-containing protein n=1 Tax=Halocynthiibacter namhaensis TaxID=1290553 RepID=UPI00057939C2|nr:DUF2793 domain-containing protein [Halocynthiibacter namhaensis]
MTNSPILSMPYIAPSQAQKHVTHNEALRLLDVLVELSVDSRTTATPPTTPVEGQRFIVAAGATGDWSGHENQIALRENGAWVFIPPQIGWIAMITSVMELATYDGSDWIPVKPNLTASDLNNLAGIGINTTSDATNKLAVSSDATLLTHAGSSHQVKVNKNSAGDTASLLFQSAWTGHAEMGLSGDTNFALKVSDGSAWFTALQTDGTTGRVSFPSGGVRPVQAGPTTWYVDPSNGNDGNSGLFSGTGAFATLQRAVDEVLSIDAGGHAITIQLADGSHAVTTPVVIDQPLVGGGEILITGNTANPTLVALNSTAGALDVIGAVVAISGIEISTSAPAEACITGAENAQITLSDIQFGTGGTAHISLQNAECAIVGDIEITSDADRHIALDHKSVFRMDGQTITLTGTPDFATAFVEATNGSSASFDGNSFVGSATGPRYEAAVLSSINTYGAGTSHLPGGSAGSTSDGGVYL